MSGVDEAAVGKAHHILEARRLLDLAENCDWTTEVEPYRDPALAAAQIHALLALALSTNPATPTDHQSQPAGGGSEEST